MPNDYRRAESKRGDISLPRERGVDPRLPDEGVAASERRKETGKKLRGSLESLRKLADRYKK